MDRDRTEVDGKFVTDIVIGSKWHERRPRDMDHSGRLYEVISIEGDRVTLDQPKSFTDAGYRLGAQRRTTMQIARLVRDFKDVTHV